MWYKYTIEYYSAKKKEQNNAACSNMDGPKEYYALWNKSYTYIYYITQITNKKRKKSKTNTEYYHLYVESKE